MSDNLRRYRAIRDALTQCYPGQPSGTVVRHLITLAALISGIVSSQSTQLPHIAAHVPNGTKPESRVKRFARWVDNAHILEEVYFLPYAGVLLRHLALQTLVLVMDGSGVGRGCTALMLHVVYKGRALPLAWRVRQAPKGYFLEDLHIAVVELMCEVIPKGAKVVFLGDGEFDGTALQDTLNKMGWSYVCRTAMSTTATWDGQTFRLDTLGACLKPGRLIELKDVYCTQAAYGPIMVLCCWAKGCQEPLYLISNMATAEEAYRLSEQPPAEAGGLVLWTESPETGHRPVVKTPCESCLPDPARNDVPGTLGSSLPSSVRPWHKNTRVPKSAVPSSASSVPETPRTACWRCGL